VTDRSLWTINHVALVCALMLCVPVDERGGAKAIGAASEIVTPAHLGVDRAQRQSRVFRMHVENGLRSFSSLWKAADGLGPAFNATGCVACHSEPAPGGAGKEPQTFVMHSPDVTDATGGHVFQQFRIRPNGSIARRAPPPRHSMRRPPALFGLGLLEAVTEEALLELADPNDENRDGISGRLPKSGGIYRRFGWKSRVATIDDFAAGALLNELGLTSSRYPAGDGRDDNSAGEAGLSRVEVTEEQVRLIAQFIRLLAPPSPKRADASATDGQRVFQQIGCAQCHVPTLRTGDSPSEALRRHEIHPYTDLLVHDMGPALSDGIQEGETSEREFRTPPLWGVTMTGPPFLHDGRARTLIEAIQQHGGEGEAAAKAFALLGETSRHALLQFLASL
jgi:CxxC motif-containing protein (DUF1111 family)